MPKSMRHYQCPKCKDWECLVAMKLDLEQDAEGKRFVAQILPSTILRCDGCCFEGPADAFGIKNGITLTTRS